MTRGSTGNPGSSRHRRNESAQATTAAEEAGGRAGERLIVAIAGPSGAGKTLLVKLIAEALAGSATLFFDDWTDDPPDIETWGFEPDADYGRWKTPELSAALAALRRGEAVEVPTLSPSVGVDRSTRVEPSPVIVIEEPFGRLRPEMNVLIDLAVCIELPLQIALARRLLRQVETARNWASNAADDSGRLAVLEYNAGFIDGFLRFYLDKGHRGYGDQMRRLMVTSDLVVDGTQPSETLVEVVLAAIREAC